MLLEKQKFLDTSDQEIAREAILSKFGADRVEISKGEARFTINSSGVKLQSVALLRSYSNAAIVTGFPEADFFRQYFVLRGASQLAIDQKTIDMSPSASVVVDSSKKIVVHTGADLEHLILRIDQETIKRTLGALLNETIDKPPMFDAVVEPHGPGMHNMRQAVLLFASDVSSFGPHFSDIALKEIEQSIIVRFLFSHSHAYTARLLEPPPRPSFPQLRLVEEYIEANWDKPLNIDALARVSNLSTRSIFRYFRTTRNCSPVDFIKSVRLRHAKSQLDAGDEKISVMRVALSCGFQSLGHFACDYRRAYGELPSVTLRRARCGKVVCH